MVPRPSSTTQIFVGVAELQISSRPDGILSTVGLGSCLGVTCYDPARKTGALLHAMLPDSERHRREERSEAMYLDTGIAALMAHMKQAGANVRLCEFKVFGGAQILRPTKLFSIGRQNVEMMQALVAKHGLTVRLWDVGGQLNRTIKLHLADGRVLLKMPNRPEVFV